MALFAGVRRGDRFRSQLSKPKRFMEELDERSYFLVPPACERETADACPALGTLMWIGEFHVARIQ